MKIAIASSGLGHVSRGIETWALDTAVALSGVGSQESGGLEVTLFSAAPVSLGNANTAEQKESKERKSELMVSAGGGDKKSSSFPSFPSVQTPLFVRVLPCLKRGDGLTRLIVRISPGFTWRWGWTSGYEIEQRSFWRRLWPILRDEGYDILHVQDPRLADLCRRYRKAGKLKTKEILAHGTEETVEFLAQFDYVQHLAPWHLEQTEKVLEEKRGLHH